jgi:hypothetical protein
MSAAQWDHRNGSEGCIYVPQVTSRGTGCGPCCGVFGTGTECEVRDLRRCRLDVQRRRGRNPKDSFSWGLRFGYLLTENHEIGALFDMQPTELELSGTGTATLGDINIFNYHAYYTYTFLDIDAVARPYLLIGLGATNFS